MCTLCAVCERARALSIQPNRCIVLNGDYVQLGSVLYASKHVFSPAGTVLYLNREDFLYASHQINCEQTNTVSLSFFSPCRFSAFRLILLLFALLYCFLGYFFVVAKSISAIVDSSSRIVRNF